MQPLSPLGAGLPPLGGQPQPQPKLQTPAPAPAAAQAPQFRDFGDTVGMRKLIYENALKAASEIEPVSNPRHSLRLANLRYEGPEDFSIDDQKQAVLSGGTLARRLVGDWILQDATGQELGKKRGTLAKIPYLTDRGTFILGGSEWTMAHQLRLRPGVFTRVRDNGELEAHVNVSKGFGHKIDLDPKSGIFRINIGQAHIPLFPLLRTMGVPESKIREVWGNALAASNAQKNDPQALRKLHAKLYRDKEPGEELEMKAALVKAFEEMELDPDVTRRTLKREHKNVNADAILDVTRKLLAVSRGQEEPDDRDAMEFQTLVGPEDLFAERLRKAKSVARSILWKASAAGNLNRVPTNPYGDAVAAAIVSSGLGIPLESINPGEVFDQQVRVTRMGEGGISSMEAVSDESRAVQPSQFGFVDYLRSPESGKVGVDARMARGAKKGADGKIYVQLRTPTGELQYKNAQEVADSIVVTQRLNPPTQPRRRLPSPVRVDLSSQLVRDRD